MYVVCKIHITTGHSPAFTNNKKSKKFLNPIHSKTIRARNAPFHEPVVFKNKINTSP
jgi:hypothetical protein